MKILIVNMPDDLMSISVFALGHLALCLRNLTYLDYI